MNDVVRFSVSAVSSVSPWFWIIKSIPGPKLSVEVSPDDSDVIFVAAVGLDVFVHVLDVHVRVSRVEIIHNWSVRSCVDRT